MRLFKTPKYWYHKLEDEFVGRSILEVGVGRRKLAGAVGIDVRGNALADIHHDLKLLPWPLKDSAYDLVLCRHILEHLPDTDKVMDELHRVLRPGGRLVIEVPHYSCAEAFRHWQHVHFFSCGSFDDFLEGNPHYRAQFTMRRRHLFFDDVSRILGIEWLANRIMRIYERRFAFIFPAGSIYVELEAVK